LHDVPDPSADHALRLRNAETFLQIEIDGHMREAVDSMDVAQGLLPHVRDPLVRSTFMNFWASCVLSLADYERALLISQKLVDDAMLTGLEFAADHGYGTQAGALIGLRRLTEAQRILQRLAAKAESVSGHVVAQTQLRLARLRTASGDIARAEVTLRQPPPPGLSRAFHGEWLGTRAVLLAAVGRVSQASKAVDAAISASPNGDGKNLADLATVISRIQSSSGEENESIPVLLNIVRDGHLDSMVFACRAYPALARFGSSDSALAEELTQLFARSRDLDIARAAGLDLPRELRRYEGLTSRERDVYELMLQGRTYKDISRTLFISESTTKVHVRHIFEKLGVRSRAEAAAAAGSVDF
jgi:DNA-binding CsgD family transcriptional regulator